MSRIKILTLDIESTPNTVHRWQLYGNDTTGITQIVEPSEILSVAWKFHDKETVYFYANPKFYSGQSLQLGDLYEDIVLADVVVTYNGKKFDIPKLNSAFIQGGFFPPKPYNHVDLYQVVKKNFLFPKMGLDYVAQTLLGVGKEPHEGHMLWVKCMRGDSQAWADMERYNKGDTRITEQLYDKLKPWIPAHPNVLLYEENPIGIACTRCGSTSYQKRGFKVANTRTYQQYQCNDCGGWFRDTRSAEGTSVTS